MKVDGKHYRTVWVSEDDESGRTINIIDQRHLPHSFVIESIKTAEGMATAIRDMHVRGAGCIGACAAAGMWLAAVQAPRSPPSDFDKHMETAANMLMATRPTAVNLEHAVQKCLASMRACGEDADWETKMLACYKTMLKVADDDAESCKQIGEQGLDLIRALHRRKSPREPGVSDRVNILTHCNAGWLAFVDVGSATAPIYAAHDAGIPVHVYVDETRPRSQGARLTAWELGQYGVPHTVISDSTGGHLMQHGKVDMVITGADCVTRTGDVANKIGTYMVALAAADNAVPFYVAFPSSTIDWRRRDGRAEIPIEQRSAHELAHVRGMDVESGKAVEARVTPADSDCANYAFDVTPHRLITCFVCERGVCDASEKGLLRLFPEKWGYMLNAHRAPSKDSTQGSSNQTGASSNGDRLLSADPGPRVGVGHIGRAPGRRLDAGKVQAFLESRKAPFARSLGNRLSSLSAALRARHSGH